MFVRIIFCKETLFSRIRSNKFRQKYIFYFSYQIFYVFVRWLVGGNLKGSTNRKFSNLENFRRY